MLRFKNILVAVDVVDTAPADGDGSLPAELASLTEMVSRVRELEGHAPKVTLMTVLPAGHADQADLAQAAVEALRTRVATQLRGGEVACEVRFGTDFIEIIKEVLRQEHDLLVVSAASGDGRHLVGHTATQLIRKCPCPVWVTPRQAPPVGAKTVLASVALHDLSATVLELAADVAQLTQGAWHVLHIPEYPLEGGMRLRGAPKDEVQAYEKECRDAAWEALHELADPLGERIGIEPKLWMAEGKPSEKILEAEQELGAHMIVLGTIGRGGLAGMVIGNTAEKVIAGAQTSVLAVKPDDFVCPIVP